MGKGRNELFCAGTPGASAARVHAHVRACTRQQTHLNVRKNEHAACTPLPFLPRYEGKTLTSFFHVLPEIYGVVYKDMFF